MSTNAESDAKTAAALAVNLSRLVNLLSVAAKQGMEAYELIQRGERDRAISVVLGVDVVLDDSKVLLGSAIAHHREKAVSDDSQAEPRPSVTGLLTAEDLVYVHKLLEAENALQEESQHLPGEMPQGICRRIVIRPTEDLNLDGFEITAAQMARLNAYWSQIAGEPVQAEALEYAFVARCSELAALRLERKYNNRPKALAINSQNLGGWVFRLERVFT